MITITEILTTPINIDENDYNFLKNNGINYFNTGKRILNVKKLLYHYSRIDKQ